MSDLNHFFGNAFDSNSVPPQDDFDVLPPGKYPVMVEKAEVKPTKAGTGSYIALTLGVLDGPFKNRKVFDNINIANTSQQCVEIGLRSLAALGQSIGVTAISNTDQLLNGVCMAHIKVKDGQNDVRTYSAIPNAPVQGQLPQQGSYSQGCVPPPQQPAYQRAPAAPAAPAYNTPSPPAGTKPPWAR